MINTPQDNNNDIKNKEKQIEILSDQKDNYKIKLLMK